MEKQTLDFRKGEILLVDKPLEWTSFDVVNKIRWNLRKKYNLKKFKVGHAGTLDPLATGLLIICTGKKTKEITELIEDDKTYTGTFLLGKTTPSHDLETAYNQDFPIGHINAAMIHETAQGFVGEQTQVPPIFSAKKINGKRAYDLARQGKEVGLKENEITIHSFTIEAIRFPEVDFKITCSKGTYIRSIANDFGAKLESGATLIKLRRESSGRFSVDDALSVEKWVEIIQSIEVVGAD
ncbi:MAG: tRNA pseudouridine(55) synthase TruB [Brumimicrobium sp.]